MTVKIVRRQDQLDLVGAPTSAAASARGVEGAPAALRKAGLADRLRAAGYQVADIGDAPEQLFQPDPDNPRTRNLTRILAMLEALRPRIEQALKAKALPVVLGGDATVAIALAAGLRRPASSLGFVRMSSHADVRTPAHTDDGLVDAMVVSHLVGYGAAELLRYCNDSPLVREPDLALFGLGSISAAEQDQLGRLAIRRYFVAEIRRKGARAVAEAALEGLRSETRDFVVHVGMDVVDPEEFPACDRPELGGLRLSEVGEALACFAARPSFAGLSISGYSPTLDADGRGASIVVELMVSALAGRLNSLRGSAPAPADAPPAESNTSATTSAGKPVTGSA